MSSEEHEELFPLKSNAKDRLATNELLVVGIPPFGAKVAESIAKAEAFKTRVVLSDNLVTYLKIKNDTRAAVDLICFVISMQSKLSFERVKESFQAILPQEQSHFIMGRWILVALDTKDSGKYAFSTDELLQFTNSNQIPVLYGSSSQDIQAMNFTAARVISILRRSARYLGISPMYGTL